MERVWTFCREADALPVRTLMMELAAEDGTLGESAAYHLDTGGQFLRARIALSSCSVLGVRNQAAIHLAAACEFLHNASLIHDDIQDGDTLRRQRLSVWSRYGINTAITLGDFFLTLGFFAAARLEAGDGARSTLLEAVATLTKDVIRGQARELECSSQNRLSLEGYDSLAGAKTGPLLSLPMEGALIVAGADSKLRVRASRSLRQFGVAYQVRDDLLDFYTQKGRAGSASDLRSARANRVVLHYLVEAEPRDRMELLDFLAQPRDSISQDDVARWVGRIRSSKAIEAAARHFYETCEGSREAARKLPRGLFQIIDEMICQTANELDGLLTRTCATS